MVEAVPIQIPLPQLLILLAVTIAFGVILSKVFSLSIRVVLGICAIVIILGIGFYWLPGIVDSILSGNQTVGNVADSTVNDFANSGIMEAIGQAWKDVVNAFMELIGKTPVYH